MKNEMSKLDIELWAEDRGEIVPFFDQPSKSSFVTCRTILKELRGPNNNLARHLIDNDSGEVLKLSDASSELCFFEGHSAVRVRFNSKKFHIKTEVIKELLVEEANGFIISPTRIAEQIRSQGVEPVLVLPWVTQSLFSNFDIATMNYRNQLWELENNDIFRYSALVAGKKMVFQSIHDVTEHAAGVHSSGWGYVSDIAKNVHQGLVEYFEAEAGGNIPSHVVPFGIGVLLDHLTQHSSYGCEGRSAVIHALIQRLPSLKIKPFDRWVLKALPVTLDTIVELANTPKIELDSHRINSTIDTFIADLYRCSRRMK